jgi:hypothetical protein
MFGQHVLSDVYTENMRPYFTFYTTFFLLHDKRFVKLPLLTLRASGRTPVIVINFDV